MSDSAEAATPDQKAPGRGNASGADGYRERLYTAWWTWPLPVVAAVLLAAEVHLGHPGVLAWLPYVLLIPLAVAALAWVGRTKIEISEGELRVADAHIPVKFIDDVEAIPPSDRRKALGPELDPAAFVLHRPWVSTSVRIWLNDEDDPTPYWVISTRRPEELAQRLTGVLKEPGAEETGR